MTKSYISFKPIPFSKFTDREFRVPGCKSISHRVLILSTVCMKRVSINNLNLGEDVDATRKAIDSLGVNCYYEGDRLFLDPAPFFNSHRAKKSRCIDMNMSNSGTSARILMGYFASLPNLVVKMEGDRSLSKRPMRRISIPLTLMGGDIQLYERGDKSCLPAIIKGKELKGIQYTLPVASAQVKSGILVAALSAATPTSVIEPALTRDHTENILHHFGVDIRREGLKTTVFPYQINEFKDEGYEEIYVPGDASSAAFWCVLGLIIPGAKVVIKNVNGNAFRLRYIDVLQKMGGDISVIKVGSTLGEDLVDIKVASSNLSAVEVGEECASSLMDEYPILSVAAYFAKGKTVFKGLKELRVKESDRLTKIKELLNLFGGSCLVKDDDLWIDGIQDRDNFALKNEFPTIQFDSVHDHRLSMSALILTTALQKDIELTDTDFIQTSFPSFLEQFLS